MNEIIQAGAAITMTSLEPVQFTNNQREAGAAELAHSDFLKKAPKVLGDDERKFSSVYLDSMNRKKPCYAFLSKLHPEGVSSDRMTPPSVDKTGAPVSATLQEASL